MVQHRDGDEVHVTIAVVTFRRPDQLAVLLDALQDRIDEVDAVRVSVLVVDNDPQRSAEIVATGTDLELRYVVESSPGVSAARNAALDHAGDATVLVFIDDDETPRPGWLPALVGTWRATGADAVVGPVESVFEAAPDPRVVASGVHDRVHRRGLSTGTEIARAATNNLLLDLARVRALDVRFDPRFGLTGGEDSLFTGTLVSRGGRIVWCAEATVDDRVPADRLTWTYVVDRTESLANATARAELELQRASRPPVWSRARLAAVAVARFSLGSAMRLAGTVRRDLGTQARGAVHQARSRGELRAASGRALSPYARD